MEIINVDGINYKILARHKPASQCAQNRPLCTRDTLGETALRVFGISLEILLTLIAINQSTHQLTKQAPTQK